MKYHIVHIGDFTWRVKANIRGRFRSASFHSPAETPEVEIEEFCLDRSPASLEDDLETVREEFDAALAREQIVEELRQAARREDPVV